MNTATRVRVVLCMESFTNTITFMLNQNYLSGLAFDRVYLLQCC